jgi:hypothetical protein
MASPDGKIDWRQGFWPYQPISFFGTTVALNVVKPESLKCCGWWNHRGRFIMAKQSMVQTQGYTH